MQVKGITVDFSVKNHYNSNNECVRNGISLILGARYQLKNLCDKLSLPIFTYSGAEVFAMRFFVLQKTVCVFIPDFQPFLTVYIKATEKEGIN